MNKKDILEKVLEHELKQQKRAVSMTGPLGFQCQYRAADGCRCYVGALMDDEEVEALGDVRGPVAELVLPVNESLHPSARSTPSTAPGSSTAGSSRPRGTSWARPSS